MKQWKAKWTEHWLKLAVVGFFSLMVLLFNQQNTLIAGQGDKFKETCVRFEKELDNKVNNETIIRLIQAQGMEREYSKEQWRRQYKVNEKQDMATDKILHSVNELTKNVILLNERMK